MSFQSNLINKNLRSKTISLDSKSKKSIFNKNKINNSNKVIFNIKDEINNLNDENKTNYDNYFTIENSLRQNSINSHIIKTEQTIKKRNVFPHLKNENKTIKYMKINVFPLGKSYTNLPLKNLIIDIK